MFFWCSLDGAKVVFSDFRTKASATAEGMSGTFDSVRFSSVDFIVEVPGTVVGFLFFESTLESRWSGTRFFEVSVGPEITSAFGEGKREEEAAFKDELGGVFERSLIIGCVPESAREVGKG